MTRTSLRRSSLAAAVSLAVGAYALPALAADGAIEEVVVTGSYIKGTPEDAALPVDVIGREELEEMGNPSIIEMVRNLGITSGNLGETNQFQTGGQGNEGVSNINLRGLGGARTLVLLNGHRHVPTETQGVDVAALPSSALSRIEILKDGAAALYGSDAISGVVNMITRSGFEGIEVRASNQFIEDSDGDQDASVVYGWANDSMNWLVAGEYQHRSELQIKDRDWALRPYAENVKGGWSSIANPSNWIVGGGVGGGGADPRCEDMGNASPTATSCYFQFTYYDNLIESQDTYKFYTEYNWTISEAAELHVEALTSRMAMQNWKTSPSYPPQSFTGPDRLISPTHPGFQSFQDLYPAFLPEGATYALGINRMIGAAGRGAAGRPRNGERYTNTDRLAASLSGALFNDAINYEVAVSWSSRERKQAGYDMYIERMAFALDGYGGPSCDANAAYNGGVDSTPGQNGCLYYNPFSNSIAQSAVNGFVNPDYPTNGEWTNPDTGITYQIGNPDELMDWLVGDMGKARYTNDLLVWDAVFSGETGIQLGGGNIGWAAGFQARNEKYDAKFNRVGDLTRSPCAFNDPLSITLGNVSQANFDNCLNNPEIGTGPRAFLAGANPDSTSRNVYGLFAEFALPITDTIDMQLAVRYEDYGGNVGSTIDPKLAVRWQANDWLALRGSASTTFRGPPQSYLSARGTSLQYISAAAAFKAVDTYGNPDLGPESATALNLGVIVDLGNFYGSIDFWSFDFTDPFEVENPGQLVNAYEVYGLDANNNATSCKIYADPTLTPTPECIAAAEHLVFAGGAQFASTGTLERVEANYLNGGDQTTNGVDLFAEYTFDDVAGGTLALGADGTYTFEYDVDDFTDKNGLILAPGGDFMGYLNTAFVPLTPKPELKGRLFAKYNRGGHSLVAVMNYVDEYTDQRGEVTTSVVGTDVAPTVQTSLTDIDSMITYDVHWTWTLMEEALTLSLSAVNLTDEDPPIVALDQNYDPFTHSAFGRMVKAGFKYTLGAN